MKENTIEENKELKEKCRNLIEKHKELIDKKIFLPVFTEALIEGGIECFDLLRRLIETIGIDLKEIDFTRLR